MFLLASRPLPGKDKGMSQIEKPAPKVIPAATVVIFRKNPAGGPPELLMVQRAKEMRFAGGAVVFPGGRIDPEDREIAARLAPDADPLVAAAKVGGIRETLEETGWHVEPTAFIGAYQWKAPDASAGGSGRHYLRMAFAADPIRHEPERALDEGIVRALWLSPGELSADAARHRSPLVWRVVEDFLAGRRHPLDAVQQA